MIRDGKAQTGKTENIQLKTGKNRRAGAKRQPPWRTKLSESAWEWIDHTRRPGYRGDKFSSGRQDQILGVGALVLQYDSESV